MPPAYDPFHHFIQTGVAALNAGEAAKAEAALRAAIDLSPRDGQAHNLLGLARMRLGQTESAITSFRAAININRRHADFHVNLGNALNSAATFSEAENCFRTALKLDSRCSPALLGLAECAIAQGNISAAGVACETAIRRAPESAAAWMCLARIRDREGRDQDSLHAWKKAVTANPYDVIPHYGLGLKCLTLGLFEEGWREYQFRADRHAHFQQLGATPPIWQHSPLPPDLRGIHLPFFQEQGIGDVLFFLRFAPALRDRGATLSLHCDSRLVAMIARSGLLTETHPGILDAPPPADSIPVGDLPFLSALNSTPGAISLRPLASKRDEMMERLAACGKPPYIGVAWRSGSERQNNDRYSLGNKEVPFADFASTLDSVAGTLICLQRRPRAGELDAFSQFANRPLADFSSANEDLESALALLDCLDISVGTSSANVHLRAGLGKRSHVLVPHPGEWRWLAAGDESPWFPGSPVYRQTPDGNWSSALQQLRNTLSTQCEFD